jgi:eukaryotic-like serine/threonine-protein kinase
MARLDSDIVLGGRYRLLRRIAAGGMGSVWEAEDTLLHRRVAVKILSEALSSDQRFVERFRREAQATAGLSHPNIAGVFDYGEDDERPFIVMELIEGETLAERIARRGRLPWTEAVSITERVAAALETAHNAGIVHRDVKPGNIIITSSGDVKVMDFGIAAATWATPLTATGTAMGTATYISPEQASGKRATPASDVYSLGVVLYEMLTGAPPFTGDSPVAVAMAHVHDAPPSVVERTPDVPRHVAVVCERALAKDPNLRPSSAGALASMLVAPDRATSPLPQQRTDATDVLVSVTEPGGAVVLPDAARRAKVAGRGSHRSDAPSRRGALLLFVLGLVLLGAILAATLVRGGGGPNPGPSPKPSKAATVRVPDVRGVSEADARSQLIVAGFHVRVVTQQGPEGTDPGIVFRTNPNPGTAVAPGTSVTLYVATSCTEKGKGEGKHKKCDGGGDGGD